ncbi:MAG TPA: FAD-dependent oxidoreductase [Steroidobacteraceae bacterium]|nr:FAD-dependent oxidoreductase [Steroidobacteraceae bacterium]
MSNLLDRRRVLLGAGAMLAAGALPGCVTLGDRRAASLARLQPLRLSMDRITGVTVCSRPFRAAGPRLELERIGQQSVIHHYGHGGSGWSLSWGSGALAAQMALATGERDIAVIGCGAIGLTTAVQLQRMGARQVTIYARELPPEVLSSFATGVWSPASRIGMEPALTPEFRQRWQTMTRQSWRIYNTLLSLPGNPVEYVETYNLSDSPPKERTRGPRSDGKPEFAELEKALVPEIGVKSVDVDRSSTPFKARYVQRSARLMFNLPAYSRMLLGDFRANGGRIVIDEFRSPAEFARIAQKTLVNCTGYGARALLGDESIIPVRGQLTHVMPQPEAFYGVNYHRVGLTPRRDGFVLQQQGEDDYYGYGDSSREPDMAVAEATLKTIAGAFA